MVSGWVQMLVLENTTSFQWKAPLLSLVYHVKHLTLDDFSLRNVSFVSSAQPSPSVTTVKVWISTAKNVQIPSQGAPGHQANQMVRCQFCHLSILWQLGSFPSRAQGGTLGGEGRTPQAKELESWCWHIPNLPTKKWRNSWEVRVSGFSVRTLKLMLSRAALGKTLF